MDEIQLILYSVGGAVTCGIAGFQLLDRFDRGWAGWWWGFLLGPFGVVIAWVKRDNAAREEEEKNRGRLEREKDDYGKMMAALRRPEPQPARPVAVPSANAIDELERLAALKEKGHVTEEEFNARKRQLLGIPQAPNAAPPAQPRRFK